MGWLIGPPVRCCCCEEYIGVLLLDLVVVPAWWLVVVVAGVAETVHPKLYHRCDPGARSGYV